MQSRMKVSLLTTVLAMATAAPRKAVPPTPRHTGVFSDPASMHDIASSVSRWSPEAEVSAWEMSGLFEGDIMLPDDQLQRNVIQDETRHWPGGVVPYYIHEEDFSNEEVDIIQNAIKEYRNVSCVKLRAYRKGDEDFVAVRGNGTGCWSYVGRHGGGQVVNLQTPGCVRTGIVQHEFLHALGFYHQQSAHNRDDFVKIHWENIKMGAEHNFKKYNKTVVTDHGVEYDYGSIMHYSRKAFSKNGEPTIEPLDKDAVIGQRESLSSKDILKLEKTYRCKKDYDIFEIFTSYDQ